jgi:predicted helicase
VPFDYAAEQEYKEGINVAELFSTNTTGMVTAIDRLSIFLSQDDLRTTTQQILFADDPYAKFKIKDGRRFTKEERLEELRQAYSDDPTPISYRPFDTRWMYYTQTSERWINSPRYEVMQHFIGQENIGLLTARSNKTEKADHFFITNNISETKCAESSTQSANFPLYIYENKTRTANFDPDLKKEIEEKLDLKILPDHEPGRLLEEMTVGAPGTCTPLDILDYVYAMLHSPNYRKKYQEFLKIDFPHVPFDVSQDEFWRLVQLGAKLRQLHLLEDESLDELITTFPPAEPGQLADERNRVTKTAKQMWQPDKTADMAAVWINDHQRFDGVPTVAWEFYIGGYQPAQKWLSDRKFSKSNYTLTTGDIMHYQKMIKALVETDVIMKKIDER